MKAPAEPDTRRRLIAAGEHLFRRQGYSGTGLKAVAATAEATWGSLYHFFPGGKEALGAEVVRYAGDLYGESWLTAFVRRPDPGAAIENVFLTEARILEAGDYGAGCPIAAVTLDVANDSESLRHACAAAFGHWLDILETGLRAAGAPQKEACELATLALATLEGAIILSRAGRSPAPLRRSARLVRAAVDRAAATWTRLPSG